MKSFRYVPRTPEQWRERIDQDNELTAASQPVASVPVHRSKLTLATPCAVCGCRRDAHCLDSPRMHFAGEAHYHCITEHCEGRKKIADVNAFRDCDCSGFRAYPMAPLELKRPQVTDFTACARCGHWKSHHCRVQRTENGETGFFVGSTPYICTHFDREANPATFHCTSAHCAMWDESAEAWCDCTKFANPWAKRKKPAAPKLARQPRTKKPKAVLPNSQLFLFSARDGARADGQ